MSFAAAVARDQMLTAYNSDLQFQISMLGQTLLQLQSKAARLMMSNLNLEPLSPQQQMLQVQQAQIAQMGKPIEVRLELLRAQQKAVSTERESIQKVIAEDAKSFKSMFA